jgi:hypothetical protein
MPCPDPRLTRCEPFAFPASDLRTLRLTLSPRGLHQIGDFQHFETAIRLCGPAGQVEISFPQLYLALLRGFVLAIVTLGHNVSSLCSDHAVFGQVGRLPGFVRTVFGNLGQ